MSKKDKDYTGFPGDCNQTQLKALQDFRNIVNGMGLSDKIYDDAYLLRFLRARKFDINKTQIMFNDFIKWRKENDVDNIMTYMFEELPLVRTHYPHGYHKTDKIGRPLYIERIGMLQLNKLFEITSEQRLIKYYIQSYELYFFILLIIYLQYNIQLDYITQKDISCVFFSKRYKN